MPSPPIPLLAEMIDSYLTLHSDYLTTDSITKAEELQLQLSNIESEMKAKGATVIYSTEKWENHLTTLPVLKKYELILTDMLKEAKKAMNGPSAANILITLRQLEEAVFEKNGRKESEQSFYKKFDILEIADSNTLIKNVHFNERYLNPLLKNL